MRNQLVRPALLLFLAVSLNGQAGDWKTYRNSTGNLSIMFPAEPQDSVNRSDQEMESHNLMLQTGSGVYVVTFASMAHGQPVNDITFEAYKNSVFKSMPKCGIDTEQAANPAIQGYIGRWYNMTCDLPQSKVTGEGNLYWGKHYAYAVMVMYPAGGARPDGVSKFLGSFAVIDPAK